MSRRRTFVRRRASPASPTIGPWTNGSNHTKPGKPIPPSDAVKRDAFPWMLEVTKNAPQMAMMHLDQAFQNFFAETAAYPSFKKKGRHDSFSLTRDQFTVKGRKVPIPKLGWVRMHELWRFVGRVVEGTISRTAYRWFLSVTVEMPHPPHVRKESPGRSPRKTKRWSAWT